MAKPRVRSTVGWFAASLLVGPMMVACTSTDDGDVDTQPTLSWTRVRLPGNGSPVTVTPMGDKLLVGARDESAHLAPRLLLFDGQSWSGVPVHPASFYAYRARWRSVLTDGTHIYAYGDAPGGAHFNPRWTMWSGDADGVREYPQFFETFGGWGAGGLTSMVFAHGQPEIVGSWSSGHGGLDIVSWTLHGNDWVRGSASGTALASNEHALNVIRAVGTDSGGPVIAGAVTTIGNGRVALVPAVWRRSASADGWARITLPANGAGQATGAQCGRTTCLAAGYVDDRLAVWSISGEHALSVADLPDISVSSDSVALVGPPGSPRTQVLITSQGRSVLVTSVGSTWTSEPGPAGTATAWAYANGHTYVITTAPDGASMLWDGVG